MQIESIRALIFDRHDVILIAKTSFGKSMIPQAVSALKRNTITSMIIPLTELGKEQLQKIQLVAVAAWVQARPPCRGDLQEGEELQGSFRTSKTMRIHSYIA